MLPPHIGADALYVVCRICILLALNKCVDSKSKIRFHCCLLRVVLAARERIKFEGLSGGEKIVAASVMFRSAYKIVG